MRLDKFAAQSLQLSRKDVKKWIKKGRMAINQQVVKNPAQILSNTDNVTLDGETIEEKKQRYLLLNKPAGYICSTIDEEHSSALTLLDPQHLDGLHFAGRLDVDTTGLVLISDDGQWTHRITTPHNKKSKVYRLTLAENFTATMAQRLTQGVLLKDATKATAPAIVEQLDEKIIRLTLTEGRYHQVKRMLAAVGNHVESLHREAIGGITLDNLPIGEWRDLKPFEIALF